MPYKIVDFGNNKYKVKINKVGRPKYMSKRYLTYDEANRQLRALYALSH